MIVVTLMTRDDWTSMTSDGLSGDTLLRTGVRPGHVVSTRFFVLWAAMLVSSTGTFFMLLTASTYLLNHTASGLSASAVFGFQWILPVVMVGAIRRICEGSRLRNTVVRSELASGLVSLSIGVLLSSGSVLPVLSCFLIRGLLEAITKTARVVYTRQLFEGRALRIASYTFNNSYYLGGALGGVLGSLLAGHVSMMTAGAVDALTFVVSACCYRWLPQVSAPVAEGLRHGVVRQATMALRSQRELAVAVIYLILAVGIFQGFHNTARTVVPIRMLHLADSDVMLLQIVTGAAIFLGAVAVPVLLRWVGVHQRLGLAVNITASIVMVFIPEAGTPARLFIAYFVFLFLFEFAFTAAQATIIQRSSPADLVAITSLTNATGAGLLVVCTLATGALSNYVNFWAVALLCAVVVIVISVASRLRSN
jgi:predicted MFS family arabinose efflux permease